MKEIDGEGFLDYFGDLEDPRLDRKKLHSVSEILLVTLLAVICGAEGWQDIEDFGKAKLAYLQRYLPYANGIPSDDTYRRFFRRIDPKEFRTRFFKWMQSLPLPADRIIAIDGKTSRHTFDGDEKKALHMVSAFASETRLVLAQMAVPEKTNEITAIPELLEWLDLNGAIVTIDAMGCQREIAQKIIDKGGDYILSLKGNQEALETDVRKLFLEESSLVGFGFKENITTDADHGRIETRRCRVMSAPEILIKRHNWPGLESIVEMYSTRELKDRTELEKRYYITTIPVDPPKISHGIREHWGIENGLHYILDISFRDDDSRIRKGNAPENMGIIKHTALNLLQKSIKPRESIKRLRKVAAWDENRLTEIFAKIL